MPSTGPETTPTDGYEHGSRYPERNTAAMPLSEHCKLQELKMVRPVDIYQTRLAIQSDRAGRPSEFSNAPPFPPPHVFNVTV